MMNHHHLMQPVIEFVVNPEDYFVPAHIDRLPLVQLASSDKHLQRVLKHRTVISHIATLIEQHEIPQLEGAMEFIEECNAAIDLLSHHIRLDNITMELLTEIRERRAYYTALILREDRSSFRFKQLFALCSEAYTDACVVLNVESEYATPSMIRAARYYRGIVVDFNLRRTNIYKTTHKEMFNRHKKTALKDMRMILADPDAVTSERNFAKKLISDLGGGDESSEDASEETTIYYIFQYIDIDELRAASIKNETLQKAICYRNAVATISENITPIRCISKSEGAHLGVLECSRGVDFLSDSTNKLARQILAELLERRSHYLGILIGFDRGGPKYDRPLPEVREMCREAFKDATKVIEMSPEFASPEMARFARCYRMQVYEILHKNSDKFSDFEHEERIALEDINIILADPDSREWDRELAREVQLETVNKDGVEGEGK